jgi:hypothetical protein
LNKKLKNNIKIDKINDSSLRQYEIIEASDPKTSYLPQPISIDDIDGVVISTFKEGGFKLNIDNVDVPAIFLTNERWAEFSKTWELMDGDKNVIPPYVTIKRNAIKRGEYSGVKYNIPNKNFTYVKVPTFENGEYGYDLYSIPQPTPIDIEYEITFFTRYISDANHFITLFLKNFTSKQYYISLYGHYFRFEDNDIIENNDTYDNIDNDRFSVQSYKMTLKAYLVDEKDFKITKSFNRVGNNFNVEK